MLKMMKMNHKLMNKKETSSNESSEDEEIRNNNEFFSGKMSIPSNIKDILDQYTKNLLNRLSNIKEVTTTTADK
jgi:hypothetical protein